MHSVLGESKLRQFRPNLEEPKQFTKEPAMGDLITQTPYSEVTATLEILDRWGVGREHLQQFRKASSWFQQQVALALISGKEDFFSEPIQHIVDCDAKPFLQNGWKVEEHKKGGQLMLDMSKVRLHLSPNQMDGKRIEGNKLRKELASESVLNANVLDYLLAHPDLIPEDWKKDERGNTRYIFFWGTIYRTGGGLGVRCLSWHDGAWDWGNGWLDGDWGGGDPSAVLAS
jgi:hypothetical protein